MAFRNHAEREALGWGPRVPAPSTTYVSLVLHIHMGPKTRAMMCVCFGWGGSFTKEDQFH